MELLTIAQASELTGKSEHAIRRIIKHLIETDKKAEEKIKHEPIANGSFRYSIEKIIYYTMCRYLTRKIMNT